MSINGVFYLYTNFKRPFMPQTTKISPIKTSKLPSGLKVITENVPTVKSVTVGIWVKTGSRNETEKQAGITHFLEHMLFKGTENRSSFDISMSMESVGGYLNAFTSSEYTCYYARCLDTELDKALDVLSDMVLHPSFPQKEITKEKKVVIEEMKMYRDSPSDYLFEKFSAQMFKEHPLGRPILGFEETVSNFSRSDLYNYMDDRYVPENIIVSVAGNVEHNYVAEMAASAFEEISTKKENGSEIAPGKITADQNTYYKSIEQTHFVIGRRGLPANDDNRYTMLLANTILGSGMSSRLHQNIREQYGYCYSISTFNQAYRDSGLFGVYVGTDQDYVDHVRELIEKEFDALQNEAVPAKELEDAKAQLKGKLLLSQESMSSRMARLAKSELYFDRFITLDELVREIDQVDAGKIQDFAATFFDIDEYSQAILLPEQVEDEKKKNTN